MRIKDNSVVPFLLLVIMIYLLVYVFFESLLSNGKPYMPYYNSDVLTQKESRMPKNSIDVLGSKDFLKNDSTSFFYKYIKNSWLKLEKGMDKETVKFLIGRPKHIEKGLTEIWYYLSLTGNKGTILFYEDKVINFSLPNY